MDTKQVDAAVAVVEANAARALAQEPAYPGGTPVGEWIEAYQVANVLAKQGVIDTPPKGPESESMYRDRLAKRQAGQAKRLLDEAVAQARLIRWSSVKDGAAPRLSGLRQHLYANAVGYTTPEVFAQAQQAIIDHKAAVQNEFEAWADLRERGNALGLSIPESRGIGWSVFVPELRQIVELIERGTV